jgi:[acyl-carrier-protein] S-malonyltransferase
MLVLICSGQGRQTPHMFDLFAHAPHADPVFEAAAETLGCDPRAFVQTASHDALHRNLTSQLLCVTRALAAHRCLAPSLHERTFVAGYSVGEMAAWGIAGIWSVKDTLTLTAQRARCMDAASGPDDTLGFVRGLSREQVNALTADAGCAVAIMNPGTLFIIGGKRECVLRACTNALHAGATHAGLMPVHVASHTATLASAVPAFEALLRAIPCTLPPAEISLIGAADASVIRTPSTALSGLAAQIAHPVDWAGVLESLAERRVHHFLELGPGGALADMARAAYPALRVRALDDFHSLDGIRDWMAA